MKEYAIMAGIALAAVWLYSNGYIFKPAAA